MAYNYGQQSSITIPQLQQQQNQQMGVPQNIQPLFPQPQGNVYNINSTLEVANVPVGAGVSVALCLPENVMYIKTMQNGNPLFYPYKITPFSNEQQEKETPPVQSQQSTIEQLIEQIRTCNEKISGMETKLKSLSKEKKGADWDI